MRAPADPRPPLTRLKDWLRGEPVDRRLRHHLPALAAIERLGPELEALSDDGLRARLEATRTGHRGSRIPAFALIREAASRTLGLRPYDEQLLAALALHDGAMVQLETGEGKTLAAVLPAALWGLEGRGVHVLTFNDYLARRDAAWMGPVYRFFGLTVAAVQSGMPPDQRREAWAADVTYATAKEAGFDLLRDQLCVERSERVHRPFWRAIVDEADSLMVDEARIPLVLAGRTDDEVASAEVLARLVAELEEGRDWDCDEHRHHAFLTEVGLDRVEGTLDSGSLHDGEQTPLLARIHVALRAHALLTRDVDYIVRGGKVELVDEFTGRAVEDRRWPDGLHPALVAKEGLEPEPEGRILGSITLQHFLRLYPKLAAMTATAAPAAREVEAFYQLKTMVIPSHLPSVRVDDPDRVFATREAKERALVDEIRRCHARRRPVLVGTVSVDESERLAGRLSGSGVPCQVLNARNDEQEAAIVADAGAPGAVTIATNMAGRGTDIRLGGRDEAGRDEVLALGGLYVIGTNRHESRRVDDQLRGRAGRQGDPGASRFFISLEDPILVRYGLQDLLPADLQLHGEEPTDHPAVSREIARAQRIIESEHFSSRRLLFKYSRVVELQRQRVQELREPLLDGPPAPSVAEVVDPKLHARLVAVHGEEAVREAERRIALRLLDRSWADQLAVIADIREGIHLQAMSTVSPFGGSRDPLPVFNRMVTDAFRENLSAWEEEQVVALAEARFEGGRLVEEGPTGAPSSTWTYIVNDDPFGELLSGLGQHLGKLVRKALRLGDRKG